MEFTATRPTTATSDLSRTLPAALVAIMLGVFVVYGVGFSPLSAAHNAAHDGRHVAAFPCH